MKITNFYDLNYPDCSPLDPLVAESEVYVEVLLEEGSPFDFDVLYKLTISTTGFLDRFLKTHQFYGKRSVVVVARFDDRMIGETLEALLPVLEQIALKE